MNEVTQVPVVQWTTDLLGLGLDVMEAIVRDAAGKRVFRRHIGMSGCNEVPTLGGWVETTAKVNAASRLGVGCVVSGEAQLVNSTLVGNSCVGGKAHIVHSLLENIEASGFTRITCSRLVAKGGLVKYWGHCVVEGENKMFDAAHIFSTPSPTWSEE